MNSAKAVVKVIAQQLMTLNDWWLKKIGTVKSDNRTIPASEAASGFTAPMVADAARRGQVPNDFHSAGWNHTNDVNRFWLQYIHNQSRKINEKFNDHHQGSPLRDVHCNRWGSYRVSVIQQF